MGKERLPFGRFRFRPQMFWQEVLPEHGTSRATQTTHLTLADALSSLTVVDSSLQFEADFSSGKNYARIASDKNYSSDGAHARDEAKRGQRM